MLFSASDTLGITLLVQKELFYACQTMLSLAFRFREKEWAASEKVSKDTI